MTANSIARFIIPVAIIYILGLVIPYTILTNINFGPNILIIQTQEYIDKQTVSIPVSF